MAFTAGFASCWVRYVDVRYMCATYMLNSLLTSFYHSMLTLWAYFTNFHNDLCIPFCKFCKFFYISRWFNFEKVIEALVADNVYHTNTVHLQTYAKDVCFIEDNEQFHTMLNFYHDLGMIVKHRSTVILKAQWLINLFKKLITIPAFKKAVEKDNLLCIEMITDRKTCYLPLTSSLRKNVNTIVCLFVRLLFHDCGILYNILGFLLPISILPNVNKMVSNILRHSLGVGR